ncbi:hypothetical protein NDU88_004963 [Pleurodeles waltl]|uniref:Uncharacterized protein n=1 Tax=Pleurodeles waltl TaxID=8319 RepID=A0AAV7M9V5_PLEWA|nr:hypothetical protein NDU88_004963 [Pleurodeles waltl]
MVGPASPCGLADSPLRGFLARLWVVTTTGVEFFANPQEAWSWLERMPDLDPGELFQRRKRKRRPRSQWRRRTVGPGPPTAEEAQEEWQRVVATVDSMEDSPLCNMSPARETSREQMDSHNESAASTHLSVILPVVTLGTADELI